MLARQNETIKQPHGCLRSGTSHRLCIALNREGLLPALQWEAQVRTQSPAIIEWLEERQATQALLPADPGDRARVRALAAIVGCEIQPGQKRRNLASLGKGFGADQAAISRSCGRWFGDGLQ